MSNLTIFSEKLPAFVKKAPISDLTKSLAGGGAQGKRISIKNGVFRLIVDGQQVAAIDERYLDVVIVAAAPKIGRTYYAAMFDPENPAPPDCWSNDGDAPDPSITEPQSPRCATCPQNIKGSGQGETRACRYSQRLAVALANDIGGDVLQFQVPATSIFGKPEGENMGLQAYARVMAAQQANVDMVVTRMKFDTQSADTSAPKLFFKPMRWLTEDEYATALEQGKSPDAQRAIVMTVSQMDKVAAPALEGTRPGKPAPTALAAAKPAAKPAPEPVEEAPPAPKRGRPTKAEAEARKAAAEAAARAAAEAAAAAAKAAAEAAEDDEEEAPPVVKQAPAAPAKSSLAQLASEWDDE